MEGEREQTEWGERVGMREERKSGCERGEIERVVEKERRGESVGMREER